jgi:hypothetical protein
MFHYYHSIQECLKCWLQAEIRGLVKFLDAKWSKTAKGKELKMREVPKIVKN